MGGGGGGVRFHQARQQRRTQSTNNDQQQQEQGAVNPLFQLLQMAPLLLLFFMSMFGGNVTHQAPPYSLNPTAQYNVKMVTRGTSRGLLSGIDYYVANDFMQRHGRERRQVEYDVQQTFHDSLRNECLSQKETQRRMKNKAKFKRNAEERRQILQRADDLDMTSCSE